MSVFKRLSDEDLETIEALVAQGETEKEYWFVEIKSERELEYPYFFCEDFDPVAEMGTLEVGDILLVEKVSLPVSYFLKLSGAEE